LPTLRASHARLRNTVDLAKCYQQEAETLRAKVKLLPVVKTQRCRHVFSVACRTVRFEKALPWWAVPHMRKIVDTTYFLRGRSSTRRKTSHRRAAALRDRESAPAWTAPRLRPTVVSRLAAAAVYAPPPCSLSLVLWRPVLGFPQAGSNAVPARTQAALHLW
jgi:hypothetical protein